MKNSIKNFRTTSKLVFVTASLLIVGLLSGCAEAERSAAMALDNAGSVSRTAKSKLWVAPNGAQATPTATPSEERHNVERHSEERY